MMGTCSPTNSSRQTPRPSKQAALRNTNDRTHYQKPQYYVKWKGYPLEESTWEPLSNLNNAQEAVQLYLNKKNQKGELLGEEGDGVRIDNSSSLETWAWEQESNPDPGSPQATRPLDHRTARLCFLGINPHKLIPRMMAHAMKQAKARKLLNQMED
ncbi:M-phase phosphoprotein 8 [Entomophthora muscae]|uniref:M-phase phosphoprotein 8 n=1 Tax=Entomophthora muscae TaxID=34485 RepID=A0ACC2SXU5_9FUNG|nr:M-phase phosphoprotein 8 [Entomophthora muscae]